MKKNSVFITSILLFLFLCLFFYSCGMGVSKDALEYYLSGERYYKLMMYEEAMVEFDKAIEKEPSFALPYLGLGKCLSAKGRFDDAVKEFKDAMDLDPSNDEILATVAIAYIDRGLSEEGLTFLEKAKDINPDNPKIYLYRGLYHEKNKEYAKAIEEYLTASRKEKKSKEPYIYLSRLYCCADNPSYVNGNLAVDYAEKALEIAPDDPIALDTLAQAYFSKGEYDAAIEAEEKALEILPDHPFLVDNLTKFTEMITETAEEHNVKGAQFLSEGNYDAAAIEFKTAVKIDPKFANGYYNLGKVYSQLGNYHEAEINYKTAIELMPDNPQYHYNLAIVYSKMGLLEESESEYIYALGIDPYYEEAHNNLGVLYYNTGRLEEALVEFNKAFEINPKTKYRTNIDMVKKMIGEGGGTPSPPGKNDGNMIQY
jgi:tetratricopeptide (TPR) repeat protein